MTHSWLGSTTLREINAMLVLLSPLTSHLWLLPQVDQVFNRISAFAPFRSWNTCVRSAKAPSHVFYKLDPASLVQISESACVMGQLYLGNTGHALPSAQVISTRKYIHRLLQVCGLLPIDIRHVGRFHSIALSQFERLARFLSP